MDRLRQHNQFELALPSWTPGDTQRDAERKVRFEPPLYLQRYGLVMQVLEVPEWRGEFHKVSVRDAVGDFEVGNSRGASLEF